MAPLAVAGVLGVLASACGGGDARSDAPGAAKQAAAEVPCAQRSDPRLQAMSDDGIGLTSALGLPPGRYALPATDAPTQLVVMFHGHLNDSCSWRNHLRTVAGRGAIAVAMNYSGQADRDVDGFGVVENYGWRVRAGAADSIAAARYFLAQYPSVTTVFAFAVSMGANVGGFAVASPDALRPDGAPLWDSFVAIEGVNNLTEEYLIIRAVAPVNADAALAQQEIEEENGGALEDAPDAYRETTNVARAPDMSELQGAVIVHPIDDGLVSFTQSPEMAAALNAVGVPTHTYTVLLHDNGEPGSTFTPTLGDPVFGLAGQEYPNVLAGHGWEGSDTHIVIRTGFEALFGLMDGAAVTPGETVVPGT
jgi:pimeloyl-ACP methyl ester carboxylesterase